jgi:hypothetical protein
VASAVLSCSEFSHYTGMSVQVMKCKPGEYLRGTFICTSCQTNRLEAGPLRNSLLGWASSSVSCFSYIFPLLGIKVTDLSVIGASRLKDDGSEMETSVYLTILEYLHFYHYSLLLIFQIFYIWSRESIHP